MKYFWYLLGVTKRMPQAQIALLLGVLFEISDDHSRLFHMGVPLTADINIISDLVYYITWNFLSRLILYVSI